MTDNLLNAKQSGQEQLNTFVEEWLLPTDHRKLKFRDPITKSKALTFSSLYDVPNRPHLGMEQVLKEDRSILQRLIIAYEARRNVYFQYQFHWQNSMATYELAPRQFLLMFSVQT